MKKIFLTLFSIFFFLLMYSPVSAIRIKDPVEPIPVDEKPLGTCIRTGCSGQICSDHSVVSTCEYRTDYVCYANAVCERQSNGTCGWTQTQELQQCLKDNSNSIPPITQPITSPRPLPTSKLSPSARVSPTCIPRPACLDQQPACKIAILPEFCPPLHSSPIPTNEIPFPTIQPTSSPLPIPHPPIWINVLPSPVKNLLEMIFTWKNFFGQSTNRAEMLDSK